MNGSVKSNNEVHCACADEEISKSFMEDVSAVKELLPKQTEEICNSCNTPCPHSDDGLTKCFYDKPKQTDDEIKVGDEVDVPQLDCKGIVIAEANKETILVLSEYMDGLIRTEKHKVKKTGRHFPQIAEVLKQMKEDEA